MKVRLEQFDPEGLVVFDYTILWLITLVIKISLSDFTYLIKVNVVGCMLINWVLI